MILITDFVILLLTISSRLHISNERFVLAQRKPRLVQIVSL